MSRSFTNIWQEPTIYSLKTRLQEIDEDIEEIGHTVDGSTGVIWKPSDEERSDADSMFDA